MERPENDHGRERDFKEAEDMELAMFLIRHIQDPCTTEIEGQTENIRHVYLNEAERVLEGMQNPRAKELLKDVVRRYRGG